MAAWNELSAAGPAESAALVAAAEELRWRAPELAVQFAAGALRAPAASEATATSARVVLGGSLVRLGRHAEAVEPALAALHAVTGGGLVERAAAVRVALAACARVLGEPLAGCELLRPVLQTSTAAPATRALALGQFVACAAHVGGRDDLEDALTEADRLLAADTDLGQDGRRLERALLCVRAASYHRRHGDTEAATEAARDGLALIDKLSGAGVEAGLARARLVLELVCAQLDDGDLDDAVAAAATVLDAPVRATSALALGRLRLAMATRVHLPSGRAELGRALLTDVVWLAERHHLDSLLADAWTFLAHAEEEAGHHVDALHALRSARAAEYRYLRAAESARAALITEVGAVRDPESAVSLLRATVRQAPAEHTPHAGTESTATVPLQVERTSRAHTRAARRRADAVEPGEPADVETTTPMPVTKVDPATPTGKHGEPTDSKSPKTTESTTRPDSPEAQDTEPTANERVTKSGAEPARDKSSKKVDRAPETAAGRGGKSASAGTSRKESARSRRRRVEDVGVAGDEPTDAYPVAEDSFAVTLVRVWPKGVAEPVDPEEPPLPVGGEVTLNALAIHVRDLAPSNAELLRSDRGEFAVLLPSTTRADAEALAKAIRDTAPEAQWLIDDQGQELMISTGVAAGPGTVDGPADGVEALLLAARAALVVPEPSSPAPVVLRRTERLHRTSEQLADTVESLRNSGAIPRQTRSDEDEPTAPIDAVHDDQAHDDQAHDGEPRDQEAGVDETRDHETPDYETDDPVSTNTGAIGRRAARRAKSTEESTPDEGVQSMLSRFGRTPEPGGRRRAPDGEDDYYDPNALVGTNLPAPPMLPPGMAPDADPSGSWPSPEPDPPRPDDPTPPTASKISETLAAEPTTNPSGVWPAIRTGESSGTWFTADATEARPHRPGETSGVWAAITPPPPAKPSDLSEAEAGDSRHGSDERGSARSAPDPVDTGHSPPAPGESSATWSTSGDSGPRHGSADDPAWSAASGRPESDRVGARGESGRRAGENSGVWSAGQVSAEPTGTDRQAIDFAARLRGLPRTTAASTEITPAEEEIPVEDLDDRTTLPTRRRRSPSSRRERTNPSGLADLLAEALVAFKATQPDDDPPAVDWPPPAESASEPQRLGDLLRSTDIPQPDDGAKTRPTGELPRWSRMSTESHWPDQPTWPTPSTDGATWAADARAAEPTERPTRRSSSSPLRGRHRSSEWAPADFESG
ncbi:hypothetical protein [Actinokineospora inagensis]|uniref:hypothetical protein n=1 Tax=Actinokineospora inagensis TaxID=103730 RepID=UPI00041611EB|nr:hypothetical protein [Actinokineospora inagensis]